LRAKKAVLAGFLLLSIAGLFFALNQEGFFQSKNRLVKRISTIFDANSILYSGRWHGWQIAVSAWQDRPVFGWGPESYAFVFDKYFKAEYLKYIPPGIFFDRPHNKVLEVMATSGSVGILGYFGLFFAIFYALARNYKKNPVGNLIFMSLFVSYFVQNLFIFDTIGSYFIFFLVVGFINNLYCDKPAWKSDWSSANQLLRAVIIAPFVVVSFLAIYLSQALLRVWVRTTFT